MTTHILRPIRFYRRVDIPTWKSPKTCWPMNSWNVVRTKSGMAIPWDCWILESPAWMTTCPHRVNPGKGSVRSTLVVSETSKAKMGLGLWCRILISLKASGGCEWNPWKRGNFWAFWEFDADELKGMNRILKTSEICKLYENWMVPRKVFDAG